MGNEQREQMGAASRVARESRQHSIAERSQAKLLRMIEKKLTTSFIGALARFENYFGGLWAHGVDFVDLTPEEKEWRELWIQARTEILNNGNNQVRAIQQEVQLYTTKWQGHQIQLNVENNCPGTTCQE